jgi:hypothetical protein
MEQKMSFAEYLNSIEPLTIGELRKAIEGLPDNVQILIGEQPKNSYSEWFNVSKEIGIPDLTRDDSDYSALTLFPVNNYDSRQF